MAVLPNGLTADAESLGQLYYKQLQIFQTLTQKPCAERIKHVRQCFNKLRSGHRMKISSPVQPPKSEEQVTGRHWLQLSGISQEFLRIWREANIALDLDHINWCLDRLAEGNWLEEDHSLKLRPLAEQLIYFTDYNRIIQEEAKMKLSGGEHFTFISDSEFSILQKAIDSGVFSTGDLLFYSHKGSALLTAEITRAYINRYVGGIYATGEPSLWANPSFSSFQPIVGERPGVKPPRPSGFYVKRLPTFASGERFATGLDYGSVNRAEIAARKIWPMSCEAFQLFGVTHKCYTDLCRPKLLALPGFYVGRERDLACIYDSPELKREIRMLAIDNVIHLHLRSISRNMTSIPQEIGFGFLEAWKPSDQITTTRGTCCTGCTKQLFDFGDFTVCSFCGSIQSSS